MCLEVGDRVFKRDGGTNPMMGTVTNLLEGYRWIKVHWDGYPDEQLTDRWSVGKMEA